jgi:phage gpG-like protein
LRRIIRVADVTFVFDANGYLQAVIRGSYFGLLQLGREMQGEVRKELSKPGTGRHHTGWGLKYRSSAPGHPPAAQSGRLRNSWLSQSIPRIRDNEMSIKVSSKLKYARILQYGGFAGRGRRTKILARPYLQRPIDTVSQWAAFVLRDKIYDRIEAVNRNRKDR